VSFIIGTEPRKKSLYPYPKPESTVGSLRRRQAGPVPQTVDREAEAARLAHLTERAESPQRGTGSGQAPYSSVESAAVVRFGLNTVETPEIPSHRIDRNRCVAARLAPVSGDPTCGNSTHQTRVYSPPDLLNIPFLRATTPSIHIP
jgi:hypothetical protein